MKKWTILRVKKKTKKTQSKQKTPTNISKIQIQVHDTDKE